MMSQPFNVIIDRGVIAPVNDREVVDVPNKTKKRFLFQLMSTVQLLVAKCMMRRWQYTLQLLPVMLVSSRITKTLVECSTQTRID